MSLPTETVFESFKNYVTINRNKIIIGFVLFVSLMYLVYNLMMGVGVVEKYQPDKPIAFFSWFTLDLMELIVITVTLVKNKFHSAFHPNVCMNCHVVVKGADDEGK